jgi:hypothetical protein
VTEGKKYKRHEKRRVKRRRVYGSSVGRQTESKRVIYTKQIEVCGRKRRGDMREIQGKDVK